MIAHSRRQFRAEPSALSLQRVGPAGRCLGSRISRWFSGLALIALIVSACECDEEIITRFSGELFTGVSTFDFGKVCVGDTVEMALPIRNAGAAELELQSVTVERGTNFSVVGFTENLAREGREGYTGEIIIAFSPDRAAEVYDELIIETDEIERPEVIVTLRGSGDDGPRTAADGPHRPRDVFVCESEDGEPEPCNTIQLGEVAIGLVGQADVQLKNPGCAVLTVTEVRHEPMVPADRPEAFDYQAPETPFVYSNTELPTVGVQVEPDSEDAFVGRFLVTWEDEQAGTSPVTSDITVNAQGVDLEFDVEPDRFTFGQAAVGESQTHRFMVRNLGNRPGDVLVVDLRDEDDVFSLDVPALPAHVPGPGTMSFDVTYSPKEAGRDENVILVRTQMGILEASIMGGVLPALEVEPGPVVDFGQVDIGGSAMEQVRVGNAGLADLEISAMDFQTNPGQVFSMEGLPSLPVTLQPGQDFEFEAHYVDSASMPTANATVTIQSNDPSHETGYLLTLSARSEDVPPPVAEFEIRVDGEPAPNPHAIINVGIGQVVEFDGTSSYGGDGGAVTLHWAFDEKPSEGSATLSNDTGFVVSLAPDWHGEWKVRLTVRDRFHQETTAVGHLFVYAD